MYICSLHIPKLYSNLAPEYYFRFATGLFYYLSLYVLLLFLLIFVDLTLTLHSGKHDQMPIGGRVHTQLGVFTNHWHILL